MKCYPAITFAAVGVATALTIVLWFVLFVIVPIPAILIAIFSHYFSSKITNLIPIASFALIWIVSFLACWTLMHVCKWRQPKKCDNPADCFPY